MGDVRIGELVAEDDVSPARWIHPRLAPRRPGEWARLTSMLPSGFDAYARLLHPAYQLEHGADGELRSVRWSDLGKSRGIEPEGDVGFADLADWTPSGPHPPVGFTHEPCRGTMDPLEYRVLAEVLDEWTLSDVGWCCIWEGYGWPELPQQFQGPPRVRLAQRDCLLARVRIGRPIEMHGQVPTMWWPEDRAWFVCTDIDSYSTYIAGTAACIEALRTHRRLEVIPAHPHERIDTG